MKSFSRNTSSGNAVFIVLIAIVLLGALTYSLAPGRRGTTTMDREKAAIAANEIIEYMVAVGSAVESIMMNGADVADISFENETVTGYEHTPVADVSYRVYDTRGGGVLYTSAKSDWLDQSLSSSFSFSQWVVPEGVCINDVGSGGVIDGGCDLGDDEAQADLVIFLPYVKREICLNINEKSGVENPSDEPPVDNCPYNMSAADYFTGSFDPNNALVSTNLRGKRTACFQADSCGPGGSSPYVAYHVLAGR